MQSFSRFLFGATARFPGAVLVLVALVSGSENHNAGSRHHLKQLRPNASLTAALDKISPGALAADLSFLSSDALQGRNTPSPGLEAAADFIASRFRLAGLEAPVNGTYFQTADLTESAKTVAEHYHQKPPDGPIVARNVIGILRGSDPKLRDTYVIVSAHYDHIGTIETANGRTPEKAKESEDKIYNGANDDGSGTVSVIAIAEALSLQKEKPRRSIVFIAFCGEELGLLGSRFYAEHPVVPLKQTIAEINLEQIGRTDGDLKRGTASLTGFDYTTIGELFARAGANFGLQIQKSKDGDRYFNQSDNLNFARFGVPDNTICTAFEFPDYHGLKDEWTKIDYDTMAGVGRLVGTVVFFLANSRTLPEWNSSLKSTEKYRKAALVTYGVELSKSF